MDLIRTCTCFIVSKFESVSMSPLSSRNCSLQIWVQNFYIAKAIWKFGSKFKIKSSMLIWNRFHFENFVVARCCGCHACHDGSCTFCCQQNHFVFAIFCFQPNNFVFASLENIEHKRFLSLKKMCLSWIVSCHVMINPHSYWLLICVCKHKRFLSLKTNVFVMNRIRVVSWLIIYIDPFVLVVNYVFSTITHRFYVVKTDRTVCNALFQLK